MVDFKKDFDKLKKSKNGLNCVEIYIVDREVFNLDETSQLKHIGLNNAKVIYFNSNTSYSIHKIDFAFEGCTINILKENIRYQIILIPKEPPKSILNKLNKDMKQDFIEMVHLISLAHELGHVEDMQKIDKSNFNFKCSPPTVDLIAAEAYAHAYSINHLKAIGSTIALKQITGSIRGFASSSKSFEKNLYVAICKIIGKGRIKKWSQ